MKKFFALLAVVLAVVSCQKDVDVDVNVGSEVDTVVTVSLPETTRANSAEGAFVNVVESDEYTIRYIFQVFYKGTESQAARQVIYTDNDCVSFPVRLVPDRDYNFVVWADIVMQNDKTLNQLGVYDANADLHYNTEDLESIKLKGEWNAMDETRDAFTGHFDTAVDGDKTPYNGAKSINFRLTRPFAKLRIITTDMEQLNDLDITPNRATVEYTTDLYSSFNAFAGAVNTTAPMRKTHSDFAIEAYDDNVDNKSKVLFTDYFFAADQEEVVNFTLKVYDQDGVIIGKETNFNTPIPARRNYLTTIKGNVLTEGNDITVEIKPDFANGTEWNPGGEDYDVEVWDGVTVTEPSYNNETKTYTVKNGAELAWIAQEVNGVTRAAANSFKGKTVVLAKNINLGGHEWTPIGGANSFEGTFNGNNKTVGDFKVTTQEGHAGLFGNARATINNLTVVNVTIVANHYAGAIVGQGYVRIDNCHVNNIDITLTTKNGDWGDKAGGIIGQNCEGSLYVKNSTAKNVKIQGYRDLGGIAGMAHNNNTVSGCSVENITILQDLSVNYQNSTPTTLGAVIGRRGTNVTENNTTGEGIEIAVIIAEGLTQDTVSGDFNVSSAEGLAWVEAQEDKYFAGKTIKLANDIDMTGVTIEKPIHFWNGRTTFDGQNYTISNLTMSTTSTEKKPFGLFGGTADIKNVKFDNANISGYSYVAVVAGNLYGNIENCHVSNSSVTCTYWMAGAMSGQYNAGNVTNCSVTNTTITGPAAVGALVGNINETAGERKVENCTVTGCTVAQNGSFGGDYDKMFGAAVGLINIENSTVHFNGCTVENTTVKGNASTTLYGVCDSSTTVLINGGKVVTTLAQLEAALTNDNTVIIGADIEDATIQLPATLNNFTLRAAEGVVLKNTTISSADGNAYHYENLTFDGITFDNSRILLTGWRNGEEIIKNLTVTNCVFKNIDDTTNTAAVHINKEASEPVVNFTFTNNVINGAIGGSKSGVYAQMTGKVVFENNVINNVSFRPYIIQITTDDNIADTFTVRGNTFSGSSVGRAQGLGNNAEGTDSVELVVSGNIFKDITESQQICYWDFNVATTTADLSKNYYSIDIEANPSRIYYNAAASSVEDLKAMGVYPFYTELNADGTINLNSLKQAE